MAGAAAKSALQADGDMQALCASAARKRCVQRNDWMCVKPFPMLQDELRRGRDLIVLRVEGTDCETLSGRELQPFPLLDSPINADLTKLEVSACTN